MTIDVYTPGGSFFKSPGTDFR